MSAQWLYLEKTFPIYLFKKFKKYKSDVGVRALLAHPSLQSGSLARLATGIIRQATAGRQSAGISKTGETQANRGEVHVKRGNPTGPDRSRPKGGAWEG